MENIKEIKLKKDNGRCDKIIFEMPEISLDKISCSYIGKAHSCMCGCSGKYSYLKSSQESAGKERGYEVDDEEICERSVKFILKNSRKKRKEESKLSKIIFTQSISKIILIKLEEHTFFT